jgi:hypothetical protein
LPSTRDQLIALIAQLSDPQCAAWMHVFECLGTTKGAGPMVPAMTITTSIERGPTVRLAYDPQRGQELAPQSTRQGEMFVPGTTVSIGQQPSSARAAPASSWLWHVLADAGSYLLGYAAGQGHWPPELRGPGTAEGDQHTAP